MRVDTSTGSGNGLPIVPAARTSLRAAAAWLGGSVAVVAGTCIIGTICRVNLGIEHGFLNIIPLLNLYDEATLPAWYSSILMYTAALLLGLVGWIRRSRRERFALHWLALSGIFVFLSMDESVSLHERLSWPMRRVVEPEGIYYYAWVLPAIIGVLVVGAAFFNFVLKLPRCTRILFILSGVTFLAGALGLEMIEGAYHSRHGDQTPLFAAMVAAEEVLEMAGIALFVYALLEYLAVTWGGAAIVVRSPLGQIATVPPDPHAPQATAGAGPGHHAVASHR